MQHLYMLGWLFTIFMVVDCFRRGQAWWWILVMLIFNPLGAIVYFLVEVQPWIPIPGLSSGGSSNVRFRSQRVSETEMGQAEAEVRRLDNAAAWSDYATLLRARKRHRDAADAATKALERDGDDIHARYERGRALLELGQPEEASAELGKVVEHDHKHDYGDALLALAKSHEAQGVLDEARRCYELLAESSSRPDVLYHLANIQERTGDRDKAVTTLRRLIDDAELTPDFARKQAGPWVRRARAAVKKLGNA